MRRQVLEADSPVSSFLEYQRSRMRLMRGSVLNLLLAVPILNLFLAVRLHAGPSLFLLANASLAAGVAVCWFAYLKIGAAQDNWLTLLDGEARKAPPKA
jgi:hypothetical protein